MARIRPPDCSKLGKNPKNDNDVTIFQHDVNVKLFWPCFVSIVMFSYWFKLHENIITSSGLMTISFIRDWPEIRKLKIPPPEFCSIFGDWGKLLILNLARMSLIECYWILQNSSVTAFTVLELLRQNQLEGGVREVKLHPHRHYPD